MDRYSADRVVRDGLDIIKLQDGGTDSVAEVVPGIGNNLFRFESCGREVLLQPPSLELVKHETSAVYQYGTPILFPPNRVKQGRFVFKGKQYNLPLNEPPDHHLHGELGSRPWEIIDFGVSEDEGAYVTSRFRYASFPDLLAYFPHPLTFVLTYRLYEGRLILSGTVVNEGMDEAPFAFGLHPYFNLPFASGEVVVLKMPAAAEWPVTNQAFATGLPGVTAFSRELNNGVSITDYPQLGCSLIALSEGDSTCRMEMKESGYTIACRFGPEFPFVVLFRPDWAPAFSLEPYTYVTDAFNLPYEPKLTGARGISAGEEIVFSGSIWVE